MNVSKKIFTRRKFIIFLFCAAVLCTATLLILFIPGMNDDVETLDLTQMARYFESLNVLHDINAHARPIKYLDCSESGRYVGSASDDWTAKVWDLESGKEILCIREDCIIQKVKFMLKAKSVITITTDSVKIWDIDSVKEIKRIKPPAKVKAISDADCSRDGKHIAFGTFEMNPGPNPTCLFLYGLEQEKIIKEYSLPRVDWLEFAADGKGIYTASLTGCHVVLSSGKIDKEFTVKPNFGMDFGDLSTDGKLLVMQMRDRLPPLGIWSTDSPKKEPVYLHADCWPANVRFSKDGSLVIAVVRINGYSPKLFNGIHIWDSKSGKTIIRDIPNRPPGILDYACFSPDGKNIAAAYRDGSIIIFGPPKNERPPQEK